MKPSFPLPEVPPALVEIGRQLAPLVAVVEASPMALLVADLARVSAPLVEAIRTAVEVRR